MKEENEKQFDLEEYRRSHNIVPTNEPHRISKEACEQIEEIFKNNLHPPYEESGR